MLDVKDKFVVLVVSCDKYADLWEPFFELFQRFWPDCPFNVYLLSNRISTGAPKVNNLLVGDDISWSDSLSKGLGQIKEEYVLLFLDDLFLHDYVNTKEILEVFNWILESKPNYVRMNPSQKPDKPHNNLVGIVSKGTIYRTSTVLSVWKRDVLMSLLKPGESAWDFEVYGSVRSDSYNAFYSTRENRFSVINGVIKAKWQRSAVKKLKPLGVDIDLSKRKKMTIKQTITLCFKQQLTYLLDFFPAQYRRKIKDFILSGKYNYK